MSRRAVAGLLVLATLAEANAAERWLQLTQRLQTSVDAGADLAGREFDGQGLDADALLATARRAGADIEWRFDYSYHEYDITALSGATLDAHDLRFPFVAHRPFLTGSLGMHIAPGFATSSNVVNRLRFQPNDLVLDVAAAWTSPRQDGWSWMVGAAIDRRFGEGRAYPLLGVDYRHSERWRLTLVLPEPVIVHRPSPRWWWGMRLAPSGNRWRMLDSKSGERYRLRERSWTVSWLASVALRERLRLVAGLERAFDRRLDVRDGRGQQLRAQPGDTWTVTIGLAFGASPARLHGERW